MNVWHFNQNHSERNPAVPKPGPLGCRRSTGAVTVVAMVYGEDRTTVHKTVQSVCRVRRKGIFKSRMPQPATGRIDARSANDCGSRSRCCTQLVCALHDAPEAALPQQPFVPATDADQVCPGKPSRRMRGALYPQTRCHTKPDEKFFSQGIFPANPQADRCSLSGPPGQSP